jgi:NAD(P)-dependent dehydrogenase (short-subunit alcohol dehydrogenase family)
LCEKKGYGDNNPFGVCCADSGFANEFIFGGEVSAVVRLKPKQGENVLCDERSRQARWSLETGFAKSTGSSCNSPRLGIWLFTSTRIIVNGRSGAAVDAALEQIRKDVPQANVDGFAGDLATGHATGDLTKDFPAVDILVNNMGIYEPKAFEEITDEDWRRFFEINVLSGVRLSRAYLSGMRQRNWGRIIFISSESGIHNW